MSSIFTSTTAGISLTFASQNPATVVSGAYITNTTTRFSGDAVYGNTVAAWNVTNYGIINATATASRGVDLLIGGTVTNAAGAQITGVVNGIYLGGSVGRVANFGTIQATDGMGVLLANGGTIVNGAPNATSALISGGALIGNRYGINIGGTGTISNFGTIAASESSSSAGAYIRGNGIVVNGAPNVASALIVGADAIIVNAGTVINYGKVFGTYTFGDGIDLISGMVSNFGTIDTEGNGIDMGSGLVRNYGRIGAGPGGIGINLYGGVVRNYGRIEVGSGGIGIIVGGGIVVNSGTIDAPQNGVGIALYNTNDGTVINQGTILATGSSGVAVSARGGTFFNHGLVQGSVSGIELALSAGTTGSGQVGVSGTVIGSTGISVAPSGTASQTVTVAGSVTGTGGTAVSLTKAGSDRLILQPGAAFQGKVDGGGGKSMVEVSAATGILGGGAADTAAAPAYISLGSVTNFSALQMDPGATANTGGSISFDTLVNQGQINLAAGDSLVIGTVAAAATGGTIDLKSGGSVHFTGAVAAGQTVLFRPPGGTVAIDHPELFAASLTQFAATDTIDLPLGTASFQQYIGGVLSLSYNGQPVALQLTTTAVAPQFLLTADGQGGTDIFVSDAACFCRGTMILTDEGEVPVEALRVGDRVRTLSGAVKPIVWIGMGRDLVTRANKLARPVIVRSGALADNVPTRDLYLTHGHAIYLDSILIPVENLVNHRSILWDERARVVEYYHLELADHDVVLANGAPAETYYDADNRALFHNTRPGSAAGAATPTFAPVLSGGERVDRVWAGLFARAGGHAATAGETTGDPDLHLFVDGRRYTPGAVDGNVYTFRLERAPAGSLRLCSRRGVPSLLGVTAHDHRPLGVAIEQIIIDCGGIPVCFDHAGSHLREGGCHPAEDGFSWTDGDFELPARFYGGLGGGFTLTVHTRRNGMRYPLAARPAA